MLAARWLRPKTQTSPAEFSGLGENLTLGNGFHRNYHLFNNFRIARQRRDIHAVCAGRVEH